MTNNLNPKEAAVHFSQEYGKGAIKMVKELKFIAKNSHQVWFYDEILKYLTDKK